MRSNPEDNKYFHYYNSNPKGKETKDCAYRALSLFLGKTWAEGAKLDAEFYLEHGMWLYTTEYERSVFHSRIDSFMEKNGYRQIYRYNSGTHIPTLREFIDKYASPDKVYLCELGNHMVAIKDNKVWDTWDSSDQCPNMIFESEA